MDAEARRGRRSSEKENLWRALMQEHGGSGREIWGQPSIINILIAFVCRFEY